MIDSWSLIKTHIHEPWSITKRALKPQLRPQRLETTKLYIHAHKRQTRYIDSPKNILVYRTFLLFSKSFHTLTLALETLWQAPHRWPPWERLCPKFAGIVTRIHLHLDEPTGLMIYASSNTTRCGTHEKWVISDEWWKLSKQNVPLISLI